MTAASKTPSLIACPFLRGVAKATGLHKGLGGQHPKGHSQPLAFVAQIVPRLGRNGSAFTRTPSVVMFYSRESWMIAY